MKNGELTEKEEQNLTRHVEEASKFVWDNIMVGVIEELSKDTERLPLDEDSIKDSTQEAGPPPESNV